MDRRALINQRCDSWRVGVHSMAPVGARLPWAEVLTLAGRCGWSEFDCQAAAETWTSLSGAELTWTDDHSSILRVRLLPLDKTDGVLDLSDPELRSYVFQFVLRYHYEGNMLSLMRLLGKFLCEKNFAHLDWC